MKLKSIQIDQISTEEIHFINGGQDNKKNKKNKSGKNKSSSTKNTGRVSSDTTDTAKNDYFKS